MSDAGAGTEIERAMDRAAEIIAGAPRVALACHVSPDGDALGSMLGMARALRAAGQDVVLAHADARDDAFGSAR